MKRTFLLLSLACCLQTVLAQGVKPAHVSVYPVPSNIHEVISAVSEKLLPVQGKITETPLMKLLTHELYIPGSDPADSAQPTCPPSPSDDEESDAEDAASREDDMDSIVVDSAVCDTAEDKDASTVFIVNRTDSAKVEALLALAREKGFYDASRYRYFFQLDGLSNTQLYLYIADMKSPYAIPSVQYTDVWSEDARKNGDNNPWLFSLSMTRESSDAFSLLSHRRISDVAAIFVDNEPVGIPRPIPVEHYDGSLLLVCNPADAKRSRLYDRLKAGVTHVPEPAPLFRPQYVVGDTLTYRVTWPKSYEGNSPDHTFRLVPLLSTDSLCRLEFIADTIFSSSEEDLEFHGFRIPIGEYRKLLRRNHFVIVYKPASNDTDIELKDKGRFGKELMEVLMRQAPAWKKAHQRKSGDTAEAVAMVMTFYIVNGVNLWDFYPSMPELQMMTTFNNRFSARQTSGEYYFDRFEGVVNYHIAHTGQGTVISLRSEKDRYCPTKDSMDVYVDTKGLIEKIVYHSLMEDMDGGYTIERTR